jgi:sulfite reductase (ferredoxin)
MADTGPRQSQARSPRPARRTAGQGQWALGHLEPLNPNERTKKDDDGLNVRARIENIYS